MDSGGGIQIPSRLPLLLTHEGVLLPGSTVRFSVDSPRNMHLVSQRLLKGTSLKSTIIGVIPNTRDPENDTDDLPTLHKYKLYNVLPYCTLSCTLAVIFKDAQLLKYWSCHTQRFTVSFSVIYYLLCLTFSLSLSRSLCRIGTAGIAVQVVGSNWPKPHYTLLITGLCRFSVSGLLKERPFVLAEVQQLDKLEQYTTPATEGVPAEEGELGELSHKFYQAAVQLLGMLDMSVPVVAKFRRLLDSLPREALPDVLASMIRTSNKEKLQVLDAVTLEERFKKALPMLTRQIEGLKLIKKTRKIGPDNEKRVTNICISPFPFNNVCIDIPFNLDEEDEDEDGDDTAALERKVHGAKMSEAALRVCLKELKRLKKMPQSMPEYALTRNYLDLMVELPWSKSTKDCLDIRAARTLLDNDHYAMDKLKRRVLEYLAVRQLKTSLKGPILCFVGPPGVGKTSVGRSIARTLGREFHRIALGGVCDQSDIRGHRRTYVGSMPGRIINGLKTVAVNNPVFLLDEVDKLGKSLQGDPAAALLEVLDPEQNHSFTDHYLNVAFDLSQVLFIATANTTATIPPALLDRMEVLQVPGYTQEEKVEIAHRHLIPNQLEQHGLTPQQLHIPQDTTQHIISSYTREAGVRSLERKFGAICRAVAVKVAEGHRVTKTEASSPEDPTQQEGKSRSSVSVGTLDWRKGEVQMCEPPIRELRSVPQCTLTVLPLPATCSGNVG
uniref:Lon peptidase 2, peroxisomal n=1 Tax=Sander lucioperca TaxID=283035 RepID=A0A8C9Y2K5_SANLU